jgi:hypothetical protein
MTAVRRFVYALAVPVGRRVAIAIGPPCYVPRVMDATTLARAALAMH